MFVFRVSLEAGGNAPFIVFDDANIDDAVEGIHIITYLCSYNSDIPILQLPSSANSEEAVKPVSVLTESTSSRPSTPNLLLVLLTVSLNSKSETVSRKELHMVP